MEACIRKMSWDPDMGLKDMSIIERNGNAKATKITAYLLGTVRVSTPSISTKLSRSRRFPGAN